VPYRDVALGNDDTTAVGAGSFVITVPASVQAGDVLAVLAVENTGAGTYGISGGGGGTWTTRRGPDDNMSTQRTYLWTKTAQAGAAGTTITVTSTVNGRFIGILFASYGVTETGILVSAPSTGNTADTALAFPPVEVPDNAGWELYGIGSMRVAADTAATVSAVPTGVVLDGQSNTKVASPNYTAFALHATATVAAGSRSIGTATASAAVTDQLYTVALAPTPAGQSAALADTGAFGDALATTLSAMSATDAADSAAGSDGFTVTLVPPPNLEVSDTGTGSDDITVRLVRGTRNRHRWHAFTRTTDYRLGVNLPILTARVLLKHMGIDRATLTTPWTRERWDALQPGMGVEAWRDGRQEFTGLVESPGLVLDPTSGQVTISVEAVGDLAHLETVPVFPDPARAPDDQTTRDYWSHQGPASTAMWELISQHAGPTAHVSHRVPGWTMGADPDRGLNRLWQDLFIPVLDLLTTMSVSSGEDLGVRVAATGGQLRCDVVEPRDLADGIRFSANLRNLVGFSYRLAAPTVTDALSAGQGDLRNRLRRYAATSSALAQAFGIRRWAYLDRRDTADLAELDQANSDALADGDATVALTVTLRDSEAATYRRDWEVGDRVTVYVDLPGETSIATVRDVVREVLLEVDATGVEKVTPSIGTHDAKSLRTTPLQRAAQANREQLEGFKARK
jgi:hypothetical protein